MGEQRGGFYSYDFIDRLLGMKVHSSHRILPHFQHLEEGDALDRQGNMVVRLIDPEQALVLGPGEELRDRGGEDIQVVRGTCQKGYRLINLPTLRSRPRLGSSGTSSSRWDCIVARISS